MGRSVGERKATGVVVLDGARGFAQGWEWGGDGGERVAGASEFGGSDGRGTVASRTSIEATPSVIMQACSRDAREAFTAASSPPTAQLVPPVSSLVIASAATHCSEAFIADASLALRSMAGLTIVPIA